MMIKINLVPIKRKKKAKPIPMFVVWGVLLLILAGIGTAYTAYYLKNKITGLEAQKAANEKKIASLKERIKEVSDFEQLNKAFTDKKQVIEKLRYNQSIPVKLMTELNKFLTEGIWLNTLAYIGDKLDIEGSGFSNSDIVTFIQNLKNSAMLADSVLEETRVSKQDGVDIYNFKISIKVKTE